jgi:hypothetical protein
MVACQPCGPDGGLTALPIDEKRVITKFIAETLLPTKHGNFRVRGYKHSVSFTTARAPHNISLRGADSRALPLLVCAD